MSRNLLNFVLFQLGWFACVFGAANGRPMLGPLLVAPLLLLHFLLVSRDRRGELRLFGAVLLLGVVIDSVLSAADVLRYEGRLVPWLCPPWIAALWLMFATTFRHSMAWLGERPVWAMLLGLIGGPASYAAGARLGALSWPENLPASILVTALVWALAIPFCLRLAHRTNRRFELARLFAAVLLLSAATTACSSLDHAELEDQLLQLDRHAAASRVGLQRQPISWSAEGESTAAEGVVLRRAGGEQDRPVIVLIHGTPGTLLGWSPLMFPEQESLGFSPEFDVLAVDVIGHGVTGMPVDRMTFQTGADWVVAMLQALELGPVCLVGQSYGGEFAWRAALDHPELVDSLVLIDSSGLPRPEGGFLPEEEAMRDLPGAGFGWLLNSRERIDTALVPHFEKVDSDFREEMFLVCENAANWQAMVDLARDENGDRADELGNLRMPTLLIWGERDLAYPVDSVAREFERRIPDSRLVVLEGTGHYPHEERPEAVVRAIESFLLGRSP